MERQIDEKAILKLLDDLMKYETFTRNEAIKAIIKNKINDSRIVDALLQLTVHDSSTSVRNFARSALDVFGVEHSPIEEDAPVEYPTQAPAGIRSEPLVDNRLGVEWSPEPVTDLPSFLRRYQQQIMGFISWFIVSAIIWIPLSNKDGGAFLNLCVFPLTIIALIVLGRNKRARNLALGILLALAANFALSLIFGLSLNGFCFIPFYLDF